MSCVQITKFLYSKITIRGHPFTTSRKKSEFLTPPPPLSRYHHSDNDTPFMDVTLLVYPTHPPSPNTISLHYILFYSSPETPPPTPRRVGGFTGQRPHAPTLGEDASMTAFVDKLELSFCPEARFSRPKVPRTAPGGVTDRFREHPRTPSGTPHKPRQAEVAPERALPRFSPSQLPSWSAT